MDIADVACEVALDASGLDVPVHPLGRGFDVGDAERDEEEGEEGEEGDAVDEGDHDVEALVQENVSKGAWASFLDVERVPVRRGMAMPKRKLKKDLKAEKDEQKGRTVVCVMCMKEKVSRSGVLWLCIGSPKGKAAGVVSVPGVLGLASAPGVVVSRVCARLHC